MKARKAVYATRQLGARFDEWQAGRISLAEFDASVQGWINHVRYADTWGLRGHVLGRFGWGPEVGQAGKKFSPDRAWRGPHGAGQRPERISGQ